MKTDMLNGLKQEVAQINSLFTNYAALTADELRALYREIMTMVNTATDQETALDQYLPQVFAICKDTCRRLSEGDIRVTANDYDHQLAALYDFVTIDGDTAIYHNQWKACGVVNTWAMVHYDEQLMGGILLHRGYAAEMATGEGKTLVATLPTLLNAMTHKGVHIMTVNDYLSRRDYELTRPIYILTSTMRHPSRTRMRDC